jgi:hypothetical protein
MPQHDIYHETVKNALSKDGWTITHDLLTLIIGRRDLYVDFGAEQPIAAEKEGRKIAVEVKSFISPSVVYDFELAIWQYHMYRLVLAQDDP